MKRVSMKEALRSGTQESLVRGPVGYMSNVIGAEPMPLERAHRTLAVLIEREIDPDYVSVSWASQEKAAALCTDLPTALAEILKRDPTALD